MLIYVLGNEQKEWRQGWYDKKLQKIEVTIFSTET